MPLLFAPVACSCSEYGTVDRQKTCMQVTGQCECLSHVTNRDCSACEPGYYNLRSGNGCQRYLNTQYTNDDAGFIFPTYIFHYFFFLFRCNCNPIGSTNGQCDIETGQCECQPGVTGQHCERCEVNFFGFSSSGCKRKRLDLLSSFFKCLLGSLCLLRRLFPLLHSLRLRPRGLTGGTVQGRRPLRVSPRLRRHPLRYV